MYYSGPVRLVLNRADSNVGISREDVMAIVGRTPDVLVPSDRNIVRAVNQGEPIALMQRRSDSSSAADVRLSESDPFAEIKNRIHLALIEDLGRQIFASDFRQGATAGKLTSEITAHLDQETGLSRDDRERIVSDLTDDILGHGPLERLLADDTISEIMVNGPHDVWIEREGLLHRTTARFTDESHLRRIINKMVAEVGRRIDE